ncbi:MAG: response regulator [Candidatus Acidiferrales bacterium]
MNENSSVEILLVEDNPADLELTLHALRHNKIANQIHVARDGEEALDFIFRRNGFKDRNAHVSLRLILLDLKLPKVHGLEVLRAIKNSPQSQAIPVVILTSSKEERDMVEGYKLGVNSYIQKPVDFESFRETVRELGLYWLLINAKAPEAAFSQTNREEQA